MAIFHCFFPLFNTNGKITAFINKILLMLITFFKLKHTLPL